MKFIVHQVNPGRQPGAGLGLQLWCGVLQAQSRGVGTNCATVSARHAAARSTRATQAGGDAGGGVAGVQQRWLLIATPEGMDVALLENKIGEQRDHAERSRATWTVDCRGAAGAKPAAHGSGALAAAKQETAERQQT